MVDAVLARLKNADVDVDDTKEKCDKCWRCWEGSNLEVGADG